MSFGSGPLPSFLPTRAEREVLGNGAFMDKYLVPRLESLPPAEATAQPAVESAAEPAAVSAVEPANADLPEASAAAKAPAVDSTETDAPLPPPRPPQPARACSEPTQRASCSTAVAAVAEDDQHNVRRFASRQAADHEAALQQLRSGHKSGCWSWWIMPTPPFIKDGREVGSGLNAQYAIRSDEEAKAYLRFGRLRLNYLEIHTAVAEQLEKGTAPTRLLGIDVPRCEASVKFFKRIASEDKADDAELATLCERVLKALAAAKGGAEGKKRSFVGLPKRL